VKFSLSWLRDHLDTDASLQRLTDTLSTIGLEVEGVEDRAAPLAPFRTAHIIEAVQHPNADRLRVCRVDAGTGAEITVVCGAPNARTGLAAVFAPPGAVVPATGLVLKVGEIRGVASAGMLVSARELGLGEDHDGIIELPAGTEPGQPYATFTGLDDPIIEIGVTPNRGDALSVRGIARDLAAAGLGTLKPWHAERIDGAPSPITWQNDFPAACPWVLGRTIENVRNGPSPAWLIRRLTCIGLRPISALVDITNFFTIDLGRPLHVFDIDRLAGPTLTLRPGAPGENFAALDGKTYAVTDSDVVIADATGVISLGGIMGGATTGVTETTTRIFVECALFDPVRIALTGRRLQLRSDARARFERGVDQSLPPRALDAATAMILRLCGGTPSAVTSAGAEPAWQRRATLRFARLAGLGGADIPADDAVTILDRLGFTPTARTDADITVDVPPWRNDVAAAPLLDTGGQVQPDRAATAAAGAIDIAPECDLIEEVLRIRGLDTIVPVSMPRATAVPQATLTPRQARVALARRVLAARGMAECVTFSFTAHDAAALFADPAETLRVQNPIAADLDQMRPTPLATLAAAAQRNAARGYPDLALFEIGPGYAFDGQRAIAAALRTGATPRHWQTPTRPVDVMDAKSDLWALLAALGVPLDALSTTQDAPAFYHPGRSATVRQGPKTLLARFGALHPTTQAKLGLTQPAVAFELFLDAIADPKRRRRAAPDLAPFQPVHRDFAFLVPSDLPADAVLRAVRTADRALISSTRLFDVYLGPGIPEGQKSLAIEVTLQPKDHTPTDADIEFVSTRIVQSVTKLGGTLR
jgi:phenylalanyl-tRNA synthetase beta chain